MSPASTLLLPQLALLMLTRAIAGMEDIRIINGTEVNPPHKYPWLVSVFWNGCFANGICGIGRHVCGGSIINEKYVITAGHCCFLDTSISGPTKNGVFVLTGIHKRLKLESWSQNLTVIDATVHELYQLSPSLQHDICLLKLNTSIEFSQKVTPVNLPPHDFDVETDGEVVGTLMGWGSTSVTGIKFPEELQETQVPLVTTETCQRAHGLVEYPVGRNSSVPVTEYMLCSGQEGGTGACVADSGGPLVIQNPVTKTYTQVGIISWTLRPCGRPHGYSVATRLSRYVDWIEYHIKRCRGRTLGK